MFRHLRLSFLPALLLMTLPVMNAAQAQINISISLAPPELPVYVQPAIPDDGYLWTPGYWAWGADIQGYYWVPGTWVQAPQAGYLWTPGYWGNNGGAFVWNDGYWGTQIGFYGGVNYGFGYGGSGFEGGYWQGGHMFYNTAVMNVGTTNITNVYNKTVINNVTSSHVSYNGGSGGIQAKPSASEMAAAHAQHLPATAVQQQHVQAAHENPTLRASANHGNPPVAATPKAAVFTGAGVTAPKAGGKVNAPVAARQPAPVEHTAAAPAERKPEVAEHKAAPVEHAAAPAEHRPAAVAEHRAAPVEHTAPPAEHSAAAPAERKPEVAEHQAAPVEHKAPPAEHTAALPARKAEPPEHKPETN
jgi:hypothetical protein